MYLQQWYSQHIGKLLDICLCTNWIWYICALIMTVWSTSYSSKIRYQSSIWMAICKGNPLVTTGGFQSQNPLMRKTFAYNKVILYSMEYMHTLHQKTHRQIRIPLKLTLKIPPCVIITSIPGTANFANYIKVSIKVLCLAQHGTATSRH